ncbi:condensin complex subunit 3 [Amblyraja radiata]|uniref:condensin complex subunit 3 n=1 Tax=Amblyraja radiata TaxID=386614 RepID=UPI001403636B|nr:condensin complex subunit 3 [Amblyraja radiata]XP_032881968.1 condensin complex subunit 3 [Amblyraja radiata]XP_032881977.1 condensin complex subunit 3 [Amblyraja radiata]
MGSQKNQLLQIRQVFEKAQKGHQNLAKLVAGLKQMYNQLQDDAKTSFHEDFINLLMYPMTIYKREPAVERVIEFVAKFATSLKQPVDEEESDEDDNSFLLFLFQFLLKSHSACSHSVRFRACQLINRLLGSMSENAQIDDELYDRIYDAMLVRLKDKFPNVRIQAVLALGRLQDPIDENCPVINAYLYLIECDVNPEVRRAVLSCIAPSVRTLAKIIGRTMDVKDNVRKLAYEVLAEKIHIKAFSIAQRVKLLKQGMADRSDAVKEVVRKKLLQAWLRMLDGNILDLLHCLDVENCVDEAESALNAMFAQSHLEELVDNCQKLNNGKVIPAENLTCENALYWKCLCNYVKSMGNKGEEALEKLLPEAAIYASYLLSFLKNLPVLKESLRADFTQVEDVMKKEFISQELLSLVGCLDTSEEGGRKCMLGVLKEILLLPNTPSTLVAKVMKQLLSIQKENDRRIRLVAEIISDIRVPTVHVDVPENADEERRRQVKLASIKVQLIEAKQALEESIASQDFIAASKLKQKIEELENFKTEMIKATEQPEVKENFIEKDDPETMLKCLIMCNELVKQMAVTKGLGPTLDGITEALILPSIANVNPAVRNLAVLCLGSAALHNKDLAIQHLPLLLQISQLDEARVKISALQAVFDILQVFGIEVFKPGHDKSQDIQNEEIGNETDKSTAAELTESAVETDTVNSILKLLLEYLNSEITELKTVAAEGFAKLLFSGRLSSPKLLTRLILLWYNPVTEDDTFLRHCLGVFFPLYAFTNRKNQECYQEAFLPTLRTLFYAPASSPLAEINPLNVAELFVDLSRVSATNSLNKKNEDHQELTIHDNLAVKICKEILKDPDSPDIRILVKILGLLELSPGRSILTEQLHVLLADIKEMKNKVNQRVIEKIMNHLNGGLQESEKCKDDNTMDKTEIDKEQGKDLSTAKSATRSRRTKRVPDSPESDSHVFVTPAPSVSSRPSRRAKTAALEKTKMNLSHLLNKENN